MLTPFAETVGLGATLMDRGDAADITIGLGDLMRVPTRTPGIAFYGAVKALLSGDRLKLWCKGIGYRTVRAEDAQLILTRAALDIHAAKCAKSSTL